ncbi:MAG: hypothetical protein QM749_09155 [Aquabacterium sp.]
MLPLLVADIAASPAPVPALRRVLRVVEAIGQRSVYFALLQESATGRARVSWIFCGRGDFLASQIGLHPLLLDELLDERLFSRLPTRESLTRDLELTLQQLVEDDPERQVEALRHFQRVALFRIAVADLTGRLPLMKVSDRLTGRRGAHRRARHAVCLAADHGAVRSADAERARSGARCASPPWATESSDGK